MLRMSLVRQFQVSSSLSLLQLLGIYFQVFLLVEAQVCSPIGQLCIKTADCCRGCCEGHICTDRGFLCSPDLARNPGGNSCAGYFCPQDHICHLAMMCTEERPCPLQPKCRRLRGPGHDYRYHGINQDNGIKRLNFPTLNIWRYQALLFVIKFLH